MDRLELLQIIRYYAPYLSKVECELLAEKNAYKRAFEKQMRVNCSPFECSMHNVQASVSELLFDEKLESTELSEDVEFTKSPEELESPEFPEEPESLDSLVACKSSSRNESSEIRNAHLEDSALGFSRRYSFNHHKAFSSDSSFASSEEEELRQLLEEFNKTVSRMKEKGVEVEFLHELLDKGDVISRMLITDDLRITLPDYGDMEIDMPALPKTVYLFFVLHPEGIRLKELEGYKTELYNIYRQVKPNAGQTKAHVTISNLINPVNNNMNEKLSQIKTFINRAFTAQMDQRLAKHYYIEGEKGGIYRLALDHSLIAFED